MFIEGYAVWHKAITSHDGEQIRASVLDVRIPVCTYDSKSNKTSSIGNFTVDGSSLALRTNSVKAKDIQQDDEIVYNGNIYSVDQVKELRSAAGVRTREYVIWLH